MKQTLFIIAIASLLFSCSKDEESTSKVSLSFKAIKQSSSLKTGSVVDFTDFKLAVKDILFRKTEGDTNNVMFKGPYELDLLDSTDALTQTIGEVDVPDGSYRDIRFKLHKSKELETTDDLYNRSLYAAGYIDSIPFIFWHDITGLVYVTSDSSFTVSDSELDVTITIDMDDFLNNINTVDLSTAVDGNGDGIIEIAPGGVDGNRDIADKMKFNIIKGFKH